jgi:hypothetical protein
VPKSSAPRKRTKRPKRPVFVKLWKIHCKACHKSYELGWTGEVKYCSFCGSDQIEKFQGARQETPAERAQRNREMNGHLIDAAMRFLGGFMGFGVPLNGPPQVPNGHKPSDLEVELFKEGYRKLATKYHPDHGGNAEKMKELNQLKDRLGL